jgi:hypothetical protein
MEPDFLDEKEEKEKAEKPRTKVPGTVEKIIQSPDPREPEKAEIVLHDGDPLYREIRIENTLQNEDGEEVALKPGAPVDVTVEADSEDTVKKDKKGSA